MFKIDEFTNHWCGTSSGYLTQTLCENRMEMNIKTIKNRRENRKKGIFIIMTAIFVLIILTTYKTPLFQNELNGKIMGFTEIQNKTELKLIATVRLDSGAQVLASMPPGLLKRNDTKATLMEGITIFGRKTYKLLSYNE